MRLGAPWQGALRTWVGLRWRAGGGTERESRDGGKEQGIQGGTPRGVDRVRQRQPPAACVRWCSARQVGLACLCEGEGSAAGRDSGWSDQ